MSTDNKAPPLVLTAEERAACETFMRERGDWLRVDQGVLATVDALADRIGVFCAGTMKEVKLLLWADDRARALIAEAEARERARCVGILRAAATDGLSPHPREIAEIIVAHIEATPPATGATEGAAHG